MDWFIMALHKYLDFSTRSRRKEFWMFYLIYTIISSILSVVDNVFGLLFNFLGFFSSIFGIIMIIPYIAVSVRRLHDVNKSGWHLLLILVPLIGWIWLFILFIADGDEGVNAYGPNPKYSNDELDDIGIDQDI